MDYLDEYEQQLATDPATADRSLLRAAASDLEARLAAGEWTPDVVHAAHTAYRYLGNGDAIVDLLVGYLGRSLPTDEEAWARWQLVDQLAVLGRCDEAVQAQREFLDWARRALPADRLLGVMSDGTQALCWVTAGRHEEWLDIFEELLGGVTRHPENRLERLYYLRTAGVLLASVGERGEALRVARAMRSVAGEDPGWERAFWGRMESRILQLHVYQATGDRAALQRAAAALATLLDEQYRLLERGEPPATDAVTLRTLYHNTAAPLYRAGEYDTAIPLFQRAVDMGAVSGHVYLWLAASVWAHARDRGRVRVLLREAAARLPATELRAAVTGLPEFTGEMLEDLL